MKYKKGYILIESIITLSIIMILSSIIYSIFNLTIDIKASIEDKIELQQQAMEITDYIDELISNSKGIIGITSKEEIDGFSSVLSIKCKYKDDTNRLQDKEIKFIPSSNKLFIKDVTAYSGYEIGDYVDKILISNDYNDKIVDIRLELSKNKQVYKTKFTVDILNFNGDDL
ncbi:MAG: prepilin-type N-terminal cleavage/methylation domain-containing protein [Romboutsia sp.]|nr:prepilin-type N-terminal cleavage/methylation domain-containing protein [Romboutsia sp.]